MTTRFVHARDRRPCPALGRRRRSRGPVASSRRGTAMIVAIVALVLTTAICFSLVRITLAAAAQAERQQWRRQSVWLAESALAEVAARLPSDAGFAGDIWDLRVPDAAGDLEGRVEVKVTSSADSPQQRVVTATAEFPRHPTDRVRISRTLTLRLPQSTPAEPEE